MNSYQDLKRVLDSADASREDKVEAFRALLNKFARPDSPISDLGSSMLKTFDDLILAKSTVQTNEKKEVKEKKSVFQKDYNNLTRESLKEALVKGLIEKEFELIKDTRDWKRLLKFVKKLKSAGYTFQDGKLRLSQVADSIMLSKSEAPKYLKDLGKLVKLQILDLNIFLNISEDGVFILTQLIRYKVNNTLKALFELGLAEEFRELLQAYTFLVRANKTQNRFIFDQFEESEKEDSINSFTEVLKTIIRKAASIYTNLLQEAVDVENIEALKLFVDNKLPLSYSQSKKNIFTFMAPRFIIEEKLLVDSIKNNKEKAVEFLLENGARADASLIIENLRKKEFKNYPLAEALTNTMGFKPNLAICKRLIEHGANPKEAIKTLKNLSTKNKLPKETIRSLEKLVLELKVSKSPIEKSTNKHKLK